MSHRECIFNDLGR